MLPFQSRMHQNRWWLGLRPRPRWGSLQRSPRPPSCDGLGSRFHDTFDFVVAPNECWKCLRIWVKFLDKCLQYWWRVDPVCLCHLTYECWASKFSKLGLNSDWVDFVQLEKILRITPDCVLLDRKETIQHIFQSVRVHVNYVYPYT